MVKMRTKRLTPFSFLVYVYENRKHSACIQRTKAQYTPATKLNSTRSTLLKVDCCRNRQQIGNKVDCCRIRSTLLPIRSTLLPVRIYEAKATRWTRSTLLTFNKVDRVEINFVVSVYRALDTTVSFLTIEWIHSTASGFTSLRYDASVRGKVGACESWMWITPQLFHISRPRLLPKILWLFMHNS